MLWFGDRERWRFQVSLLHSVVTVSLLLVSQLSSIIPLSLLLATESFFHPSNPLSYFMHSMDALQCKRGMPVTRRSRGN